MTTLEDELREIIRRIVREEIRGEIREEINVALQRIHKAQEPAALAPVSEFLTVAQASQYTGLAARTLYNLKSLGTGPRSLKLGRLTRYRRADLDEWLTVQLVPQANS